MPQLWFANNLRKEMRVCGYTSFHAHLDRLCTTHHEIQGLKSGGRDSSLCPK